MAPTSPFKPAASYYYASGSAAAPLSGTMSDPSLSGAWMIEHQDLTIDYVRVPWADVSATNITLSTGSMAHRINATRLAIAVKATYSKRKVYGSYSTSSYQQPQKFQVNAVSADHMGNTYGDLSGGASGTAMGPAGTIVTYQPWMQRRRWDSTIDTETSKSADGYLFYVKKSSCDGTKHLGGVNVEYMTDFEGAAGGQGDTGCFYNNQYMTHDSDARLQVMGSWYNLIGAYSTSKETTAAIFTLIDQMGDKVTVKQLMAEPTSDGNGQPGFGEGFSEYDVNRHDYTA